MTDVVPILNRIFQHLAMLRRPVATMRKPGLPPATIATKLAEAGLSVEHELAALYAFADGADGRPGELIDAIDFFAGFHWMALDEALHHREMLIDGARWQTGWLPILANGGGDFYAVICDADDPHHGAVIGYVFGEPAQIIEFPSVAVLLAVIEASYDEGAISVESGCLVTDFPKMRAISARISPGFQPILLRLA